MEESVTTQSLGTSVTVQKALEGKIAMVRKNTVNAQINEAPTNLNY